MASELARALSSFEMEDGEQSLPARFEQQAKRYPGRIAVRCADRQLTYDDLNRAANRLAHSLLESRGEREEPVAFLIEDRVSQVIAILAILKSGKFYLPLDSAFGTGRMEQILNRAKPALLLYDDGQRLTATDLARRTTVQALDLEESHVEARAEDPDLAFAATRSSMVLYTSGSTGRPKGVLHKRCCTPLPLGSVIFSPRCPKESVCPIYA